MLRRVVAPPADIAKLQVFRTLSVSGTLRPVLSCALRKVPASERRPLSEGVLALAAPSQSAGRRSLVASMQNSPAPKGSRAVVGIAVGGAAFPIVDRLETLRVSGPL